MVIMGSDASKMLTLVGFFSFHCAVWQMQIPNSCTGWVCSWQGLGPMLLR